MNSFLNQPNSLVADAIVDKNSTALPTILFREGGADDGRQARTQRTANGTVHAIGCLAHSDIRKCYDEHGMLRPIHSLPDDLAVCIASIEVVTRNLIPEHARRQVNEIRQV